MSQSLTGRTAIITGAGHGIGAAIAKRVAADGANVVVNFHSDEDEANNVERDIAASGGAAISVQADVSDPAEVAQLFDTAEARFGSVSLLVNNAAQRGNRARADEIELDDYHSIFASNVQGPLLCMLALTRRLRGSSARIVNITSGQARAILPNTSLYAATKGALEALTRGFAADLGAKGITVNALAPGATATERFTSAVPKNAQEETIDKTALGRLGTPEDVAKVAAFLLSEDAEWITGQVIDANGGLSR